MPYVIKVTQDIANARPNEVRYERVDIQNGALVCRDEWGGKVVRMIAPGKWRDVAWDPTKEDKSND